MSTSVVILCSGKSKKMQSYGNRSLLPIKSTTLIEQQIKQIKAGLRGFDVVCVLGYEHEKLYNHLKDKKIRCVMNDDYEENGSLKSTVMGLRATTSNNVWVMHHDILPKKSFFYLRPKLTTAIINSIRINDIGVLLSSSSVLRFSFGMSNTWGKIIYLNKESSGMVRDFRCTPQNEKYLDFEMYNAFIDQGLEIDSVKHQLVEINSTKDLKCVQ